MTAPDTGSTMFRRQQTEPVKAPAWLSAPPPRVQSIFAPKAAELPPPPAPPAPKAAPVDPVQSEREKLQRQVAEAKARAEREGRAAGEEAGQQAWRERLERAEALIGQLAEARGTIFAELEAEMIKLALHIAGAIVGRELRTAPSTLLQIVQQAVALVPDTVPLRVRLAPADVDALSDFAERIEHARSGRVIFVADERVELGCIVESDVATVDATLATRLDNIAQAIGGGL